eukprot:Lankesteria_metandrocarpae@DN5293_c0_g1_i2.p1
MAQCVKIPNKSATVKRTVKNCHAVCRTMQPWMHSFFYAVTGWLVMRLASEIGLPVYQWVVRKLKRDGVGVNMRSRFGKWAVVTGATDGIGKEISLLLAKRGMNVLAIGRDADKLKTVKQDIKNSAGKDVDVQTLQVDFSTATLSTYNDVITPALAQLDDLGLLVNNVGVSYPSALYFDELEPSFLDTLIDVNLRSTLQMTRIVLPGLRAKGKGGILCVGSGASVLPTEPLYSAYVGVKSAVEAFCRSLQIENVGKGVLVQCHTPLLVATKLSKVRKPSLTVPSTYQYAHDALAALNTGHPKSPTTVVPSLAHGVMLGAINLIPKLLWASYRFKATTSIRRRYLKKLKEATD